MNYLPQCSLYTVRCPLGLLLLSVIHHDAHTRFATHALLACVPEYHTRLTLNGTPNFAGESNRIAQKCDVTRESPFVYKIY